MCHIVWGFDTLTLAYAFNTINYVRINNRFIYRNPINAFAPNKLRLFIITSIMAVTIDIDGHTIQIGPEFINKSSEPPKAPIERTSWALNEIIRLQPRRINELLAHTAPQ